jgi:hypothetical protein
MTTQKRKAIFDDATPSQRASLVREHINRCRTLNEKKLDHEQAAAIDEALRDLITEEMYTFPLTPAQEKKRDSWKRRVEGIFSGNQLAQFFSLDTPCK